MLFGGLLDLALVIFLVLLFAEYAKLRKSAEKGFKLIAGAGILFLLAYTFSGLMVWNLVLGAEYGLYLFEIIGWIFLLVGAIWAALELSKK